MAKQKWRVWHAVGTSFSSLEHPHEWAAWKFNLVAVVEAEHLDEAFRLTNHTDVDWTTNDGVQALVDSPRSTSVGDVLEDGRGYAYLCAPTGWGIL